MLYSYSSLYDFIFLLLLHFSWFFADFQTFTADTTPLFEDTTTLTDLPRDGRQLNDEDQPSDETIGGSQPSTNNPLSAYFDRIRDIYELDLKILEQLADLLAGIF